MDIGNKIRELRTRKGLTLEELASRSELTKGFLSQLERDLTSPSIDSLSDILEALGTNLAEFFQEDKNDQFIFHADDFFVDEREDCTVNWIVPNTQKNQMEPILLELPEGGESFTVEPHDGEEFGYVVEGSVVLVCDGEEHPLRRGETFLTGIFHSRIAAALLRAAGGTNPIKLAQTVKKFRLTVRGCGDQKQSQVTRGGAALTEFDSGTLRSLFSPRLYAAGEALDIDGACGGYNLHWAFASGILAAHSAIGESYD